MPPCPTRPGDLPASSRPWQGCQDVQGRRPRIHRGRARAAVKRCYASCWPATPTSSARCRLPLLSQGLRSVNYATAARALHHKARASPGDALRPWRHGASESLPSTGPSARSACHRSAEASEAARWRRAGCAARSSTTPRDYLEESCADRRTRRRLILEMLANVKPGQDLTVWQSSAASS